MTPLSTTPLFAFALSLFLHSLVASLFPKFNLLDFPSRYGLTRPRLPYPAGIASVVAFLLLSTFLVPPVTPQGIALLVSILLLAIVCVIDDRRPLPAWARLLTQVIVGLILFVSGMRIYSLTNPLSGLTGVDVLPLDQTVISLSFLGSLPVWSGVFTVGWILLTINALNWFDGIPGQTSTISTIGFLTIGFLAMSSRVDQPELALVSFCLAGIALASLVFDFPPNKVVMGDTGSMFFGLMLGVLTLYSGGKVATAFLVLGVPLFDSFFVIARRLARGLSPFAGDAKTQHLHHRLLAKGWSPRQVILLTAALGTAFGTTALFLDTLEKFIAAGVLFIVMLGLSWYSRPKRD